MAIKQLLLITAYLRYNLQIFALVGTKSYLLTPLSGSYWKLNTWRPCCMFRVSVGTPQASNYLNLGKTYAIKQRSFGSAATDIPRNPAFSNLNADDISYFRTILGERNVVEDEDRLSAANVDWMRKYQGSSKLLLLPKSSQEVPDFKFVEVSLLFGFKMLLYILLQNSFKGCC